MFPAVRLFRGVSFVDAGQALTSVGGAKSYDVAMYLVETLYGEKAVRGIGRGLVIDWDRSKLAFHKKGILLRRLELLVEREQFRLELVRALARLLGLALGERRL